ncbi:MAG: hypothetical protein ACE5EI_08715, partial [Thermodesulfobacteriota bacterium]
MVKRLHHAPVFVLLAVIGAWALSGCSPVTTGAVKEDVTLTEQTRMLEEAGARYRGPRYNVAILEFDNRTPGGAFGVGEAATDILRTLVKSSGLEPVVLTKDEMREQERLIELQQTGALK